MPSSGAAKSKRLAGDLHHSKVGEQNRRRWERLPIAIPIFVRGSDETGNKFEEFSTATNLNAGGMLLVSRRALSPGLRITLEIPTPTPLYDVPGYHSKNPLSATILYVKHSEGLHLSGVEFSSPLLPDRNDS